MSERKFLRIAYLILLIAVSFLAQSQDLVITKAWDSLNCDIIKETDNSLIYKVNRTLIRTSKDSIQYFKKDYFFSNKNSMEKKVNQEIRIGMDFGIGLIGDADELNHFSLRSRLKFDQEDYYNELRSGLAFNFDCIYFLHRNFGIGLNYSFFHSKNKLTNVQYNYIIYSYSTNTTGTSVLSELSDDIEINTIGLTLGPKFNINNKINILFLLSPGIFIYSNSATDFYKYIVADKAFCFSISIASDFKLDKYLTLSPSISIKGSTINNLNKNDKVLIDRSADISRFDFSLGLKWYF